MKPSIAFCVAAGALMLATLQKSLLMPAIALFGFGWGSNYSLLQAISADVFGSRSLGRVMGAVTVLDAGGGALDGRRGGAG